MVDGDCLLAKMWQMIADRVERAEQAAPVRLAVAREVLHGGLVSDCIEAMARVAARP
jgi:hypothetical protein